MAVYKDSIRKSWYVDLHYRDSNGIENAVKIEPAHRTSRATASESKSHPKIGWL